uniref:WSC domain-containing protein 2-like n=1 Tax=Ciona intestinalis TaxID=7719 RepID=UPI000EF4BD3B|nr:WSC domain-containing protein 2-like [Ciona intestinalis]|eukprot:XP_026696645.1 WSC domain-containing protein 2-like [Ciona intestinalis]
MLTTVSSQSSNRNLQCTRPGFVSVSRTLATERCGDTGYLNNNTLPLVALVSHPGSGNSWLRYLLEGASGIYTGSIYKDPGVFKSGMFGEGDNPTSRRTLVVKAHPSHEYLINITASFDKIVLLIRNPYEAFVAEFNRKMTKDHTGFAQVDDFNGEVWLEYIRIATRDWAMHQLHLIQSKKPLLLVTFDELRANMSRELRRILYFIGYKPPDMERRLECLGRNPVGDFKRPQTRTSYDPYVTDTMRMINHAVETIRKALLLKNLGNLPKWERDIKL